MAPAQTNPRVMAVVCGDTHTAFITEDGYAAWAVGSGIHGQLGHGDAQPRCWPSRLNTTFGDKRLVLLASGSNHMAAVTDDGSLWTWGEGRSGQLGHGDWARKLTPLRVESGQIGFAKAAMVACGSFHTVALAASGVVWSCGGGDFGQLGHGPMGFAGDPTFKSLRPSCFGGAEVVAVAAGAVHSAALAQGGVVWTWGSGGHGELGHGDRNSKEVPMQLGLEHFGGSHVVMLAAGGDHILSSYAGHSVAVTRDGGLFAWGSGCCGQLGQGDQDDRLVPSRVGADLFGATVQMATCGDRCTLAVTREGLVYAFGAGEEGQLGCDVTTKRLLPALVPPRHFEFAKVVTAASGYAHSAAVTEDGRLFTWGCGRSPYYRQSPSGLGTGSLGQQLVPALVSSDHLRGALVGIYCHRALAPCSAVAFAMGTHARLGPASMSELLPELVRLVVEACECSWAGEAEAIARCVGGSRMKVEGGGKGAVPGR